METRLFRKIKKISLYVVSYLIGVGVLSYFFYKSYVMYLVLLVVFAAPFIFYMTKVEKKQRTWKALLDFKEMIRILSSEIQSGMSAENAFICTYSEMNRFDSNSPITEECKKIVKGLNNNEILENLLLKMSQSMQIEEITEFTQVFIIAKRSGGSIKEIIEDTQKSIDTRIDMKREYRIMLSSKQFEHRIMSLIPFIILGYIDMTSRGYFDIFYTQLVGRMIMTVIMIVYLGAVLWGEKIINMKI